MALPENQLQPTHKVTAWGYLDMLLRFAAFFLGIAFLLGSLWAARDGSYPNITGLSQAALMFLCVVSPLRPSRLMLTALLIAVMLAGIDFAMRALPDLRHEKYPPDIVMIYVAELIIVIWFMRKQGKSLRGR
jgi:uncharacterized Tic20 family protein